MRGETQRGGDEGDEEKVGINAPMGLMFDRVNKYTVTG
jgi:hypothetical protein